MSWHISSEEDLALANAIKVLVELYRLNHPLDGFLSVHEVLLNDIGRQKLVTAAKVLERNARLGKLCR